MQIMGKIVGFGVFFNRVAGGLYEVLWKASDISTTFPEVSIGFSAYPRRAASYAFDGN